MPSTSPRCPPTRASPAVPAQAIRAAESVDRFVGISGSNALARALKVSSGESAETDQGGGTSARTGRMVGRRTLGMGRGQGAGECER
eukprot:6184638-Pleurochrysis_carterae.AAC.4